MDVCAIIANKKFSKKNYVDLFAGSGMNRIRDKYDDYFVGSPFIALLNHQEKFTKFFFCENNKNCFNALNKRMSVLGFGDSCLEGNCNQILADILKRIGKDERSYNFFFVDLYNLEFSWDSMKRILGIRSDILLTFMPKAIWRSIAANKKTKNKSPSLDRFFGDSSWKNVTCEEEVIELYQNKIINERKDAVIVKTKINSQMGFNYYLLFITHKTSGNNPWLNAIKSAKEEIEKHSDLVIKSLLDVIKKRQLTLD